MGVIDSRTFTISCDDCGSEEQVHVVQYGSNWGADDWQNPEKKVSSKFWTQWGDLGTMPNFEKGKCLSCLSTSLTVS